MLNTSYGRGSQKQSQNEGESTDRPLASADANTDDPDTQADEPASVANSSSASAADDDAAERKPTLAAPPATSASVAGLVLSPVKVLLFYGLFSAGRATTNMLSPNFTPAVSKARIAKPATRHNSPARQPANLPIYQPTDPPTHRPTDPPKHQAPNPNPNPNPTVQKYNVQLIAMGSPFVTASVSSLLIAEQIPWTMWPTLFVAGIGEVSVALNFNFFLTNRRTDRSTNQPTDRPTDQPTDRPTSPFRRYSRLSWCSCRRAW